MSQKRLTLGKASLLMLALGTGALMGIPGMGIESAPRGPIQGLVREDSGGPLEDAELALFDHKLSLVEITRSDAHGRFAFGQEPARYHIFASPPEADRDELLGAWALDQERSLVNGIELQLFAGRWISLIATDFDGQPLAAAEVRILDASLETPRVVQRRLTDAKGYARVLAPKLTHIGIFASGQRPAIWITDVEVSGEELLLAPVLPQGRTLTGTLLGSDERPLEGAILSAWSAAPPTWHGWTQSDAQGNFSLLAPIDDIDLRIIDPEGGQLPMQVRMEADSLAGGEWVLRASQPKRIQTESLGQPVVARVWAWSAETQAWGWGVLTDESGLVSTHTARLHSIVAVPLDSNLANQEAWNHEWNAALLQLHAAAVEME